MTPYHEQHQHRVQIKPHTPAIARHHCTKPNLMSLPLAKCGVVHTTQRTAQWIRQRTGFSFSTTLLLISASKTSDFPQLAIAI